TGNRSRDYSGVPPRPSCRADTKVSETQRAMVAAKIAKLEHGQRKSESPIGDSVTQQEAADLLNVGKRSVERAREVLEHGTPELIEAVERGKSLLRFVIH